MQGGNAQPGQECGLGNPDLLTETVRAAWAWGWRHLMTLAMVPQDLRLIHGPVHPLLVNSCSSSVRDLALHCSFPPPSTVHSWFWLLTVHGLWLYPPLSGLNVSLRNGQRWMGNFPLDLQVPKRNVIAKGPSEIVWASDMLASLIISFLGVWFLYLKNEGIGSCSC